MSEEMFVLHENGSGQWEKYDDTYDITIHCKDQKQRDYVMKMIKRAAQLIMEEKEKGSI